jgi:CDP-glucose 4,6-dehydratase
MNVLVTGSEGFLGNSLVKKLKNKGHFVVGLEKEGNLRKRPTNNPDVLIRGDMRDYHLLNRILTEYEIDEVFHLASWPIARICANDPYTTFDINVMGIVTLLEVCRKLSRQIKGITISTSDKAFGNAPVPYTEKSELHPIFIYDTSKACQQLIALSYYNNYKLPIKIVACSNIYGPGDYNMSRVIPNTINRLSQGKPAIIWEDSQDHIRELVYVDDAAESFIVVSENGKNGEVYCCGGTDKIKVSELMVGLCNLMDKNPNENIEIVKRPVNLKEIEEQYIDASKIKSIGWEQKTSLEQGLRNSIEFYSNFAKEFPEKEDKYYQNPINPSPESENEN